MKVNSQTNHITIKKYQIDVKFECICQALKKNKWSIYQQVQREWSFYDTKTEVIQSAERGFAIFAPEEDDEEDEDNGDEEKEIENEESKESKTEEENEKMMKNEKRRRKKKRW